MAKLDMTDYRNVLGSFMQDGANDYDPKLIGASIRSIASTGRKMDARIHATAVALAHRSADHRDCSLVPALIDAMPKSARRKALIAWFHAFTNVAIRTDDKGKVTANMHGPKSKMFKVSLDLAKAEGKPFWQAEEAAVDPRAFDDKSFAKAIAGLIARAKGENAKLSPAAMAKLADLEGIAKALAPAK